MVITNISGENVHITTECRCGRWHEFDTNRTAWREYCDPRRTRHIQDIFPELTKEQGLVIKKVARYYTDRRRYWVCDILRNNHTNALVVNWCEQSWGRKHQAVWSDVDAYQGQWGYCDLGGREEVLLNADWLNGFEGTRYAHIAYYQGCGMHIMKYLECWHINKATDILIQNAPWLVTKGFVTKLTKNKGLQRYFRSSFEAITRGGYGPSSIVYAYKHGVGLEDAHSYIVISNWMAKNFCKLPFKIDKHELAKRVGRGDFTPFEYGEYLRNLSYLGGDINAHGAMFPTHATMDIINERAKRRWEAECRKRQAKQLAKERREERKRLAHWKKVCGYTESISGELFGEYTVEFTTDNDKMVAEGNAMHNCVGEIYRNEKEELDAVMFVRKDGKPFADFRVNVMDFRVMEARIVDNHDAPKDIHRLAEMIARKMKRFKTAT